MHHPRRWFTGIAVAAAAAIATQMTFAASLVASVSAQAAATRSAAAREGLAPLPGVRIWYVDTGGSGEPVVFLHAATGSSQAWQHQVPAFTAAGYRVVTYDRRGYGRSVEDGVQPSPGTGPDDLDALISYLGIERFHMVSTGAGAMVGLDYAVSFPQRLRSMVIANTMGAIRDPEFVEMGRRIRPPQFNELGPQYKELSPSYRAANPEGVQRWLDIERTNHPNGPVMQRSRNRMTFALLEGIKIPTLFLAGEADPYMPPPIMRIMAAHVPGAASAVIPETSHSAFWEQPELFNQHVLDFIRQH